MKKCHQLRLLLIALTVSTIAGAQTDSTKKEKDLQFKIGLYFNSNLNYYGRTDSLQSSGVFPIAELWFKKHFYINAAPVFTNNKIKSFEYAGSVATAGYQFRNKKWAGNTYIVKPIYKDNSRLVQSALKVQAATSFSRLTKIIAVTVGGDIKYSDKIDYGATAGLDHLFRFELAGNSVLVIDPSAYVNAGTQRFSRTTYKPSDFILFPGVQEQVTEEINKFNILSYEFSMPVVFAKGKVQLIAIPAYVLPQNLVIVQGRPDLSERGQNTFYATIGAKMIF